VEKPTFIRIRLIPSLEKIPLVIVVVEEANVMGIMGIVGERNT
jgi:hypothetical protein